MQNIFLMFFVALFVNGCGCGDVILATIDNHTTPSSKLVVSVIEHNNSNYYVANLSDAPYYVAINVENKLDIPATIKAIDVTDQSEFKLVMESKYYPANQNICHINTSLALNQSCEILVGLNQAQYISNSTGEINITTDTTTYTKHLIKHSVAYIAGDFSKTYNSQPIINPLVVPNAHCGVNQDSLCSILEYDIESDTVVKVAQTNWNVNSIVADKNGVLYIAGGFDTGYTTSQTIIGPTALQNSTMILTLNPTSSKIDDFIKSIGQNNYPDSEIYTLAYTNDNLYMAGGFSGIGNISIPNAYPVVRYNFDTNSLANALGDSATNPDLAVSAIGFDSDSNLYISGLYSAISNFYNSQPFGIFSINRCKLNGDLYTCGNGVDDFSYIDATVSYQPAASITFDNRGNLFTAGGFSQISNIGFAGTSNYLLVEYNDSSLSWASVNSSQAPDRTIGVVTPLNDNQGYYAGGWFSTIGGLAVNLAESGQCGIATDQFSDGVNSCMLARYDKVTNTWSKVFTTDGMINTFTISSKISASD